MAVEHFSIEVASLLNFFVIEQNVKCPKIKIWNREDFTHLETDGSIESKS